MANFFKEEEFGDEAPETSRPGLATALLLLLLILAMLTTLMWPLIQQSIIRLTLPPTPTPPFLQEA